MIKKFLYMALLSLLITAFFSACERLVDKASVITSTGKGTAAEIK
ncbi:hypothetical protein [Pontibacter diazotrophicus]|nr:hypothetical protein [Pontibacter diazotrophicus]